MPFFALTNDHLKIRILSMHLISNSISFQLQADKNLFEQKLDFDNSHEAELSFLLNLGKADRIQILKIN